MQAAPSKKKGGEPRIVVFIDDLDRCKPNKIIEVRRAAADAVLINHLLLVAIKVVCGVHGVISKALHICHPACGGCLQHSIFHFCLAFTCMKWLLSPIFFSAEPTGLFRDLFPPRCCVVQVLEAINLVLAGSGFAVVVGMVSSSQWNVLICSCVAAAAGYLVMEHHKSVLVSFDKQFLLRCRTRSSL